MPATINCSSSLSLPRKRTGSSIPFPDEPPTKKTMNPLRRSETLLFISSAHQPATPVATPVATQAVETAPKIPYNRTLRYYKDVRDRRPRCNRRSDVIVLHTPESASNQKALLPFAPTTPITPTSADSPYTSPLTTSPPRIPRPLTRSRTVSMHLSSLAAQPVKQTPLPKSVPHIPPSFTAQTSGTRMTSPLSPHSPMSTPPRPSFPRSKPQMNLHRAAIQGCMRDSPHGQKILHMGARLAVSLARATEELERLVAMQAVSSTHSEQQRYDEDVAMDDVEAVMSTSWVDVRPASDDWVMLDQTQCVV